MGIEWSTLLPTLLSGGVAGVITGFASTRIEWRRLRNEEKQRSAYFEQELFRTRLASYQAFSKDLAGFAEDLRASIEPLRQAGSWTQQDRKALDDQLGGRRASLTRLVMELSPLFGPAMDDALNEWTMAVNILTNRRCTGADIDADQLGPNQVFTWVMSSHWAVLQAMRSDLRLATLDSRLIDNLG